MGGSMFHFPRLDRTVHRTPYEVYVFTTITTTTDRWYAVYHLTFYGHLAYYGYSVIRSKYVRVPNLVTPTPKNDFSIKVVLSNTSVRYAEGHRELSIVMFNLRHHC